MNKKKVLLTGASRGIGKAILSELRSSGKYDILSPSRKDMDLSQSREIQAYMECNSDIDIVINNAGINVLGAIEKIDKASLELMFQINVAAPFELIRYVVSHMKAKGFGRIINISSIWGVRSKEYRTLYSITKFGINGMTRALARELGPFNILVNSVCPGFVSTEMTQKNLSVEEQEKIKREIPLRRFSEPQEIAKFISFLISEDNTYLTGQTIIIDGGFLA